MKPIKLLLVGIQGSGKSTQGNLLSKQLRLPYLSTGHILREMAKEKSPTGRYIKETINSGILVPDSKMIPIVEEYLSRPAYQNGYILDGFPRTLSQAKMFKNGIDHAIYLDVPDTEALWRIAHRDGGDREDETLTAIKKRIEMFHKFTTPVIEYYKRKDKLIEVDGTESIKDVNEFILKSLGKTIGKNGVRAWQKRSKLVLALVGLPGAGKDEAAKFFSKKDFPVLRLGDITDDLLKERGLPATNENEKKLRENMRKEHGMDAYIKTNEKKINAYLEHNKVVVINGMRSWEEYLYAKKAFKNVFVLAITAEKRLRYKRIKARAVRSSVTGEERDIAEVLGLNMGPTIALADKTILNDGTMREYEEKLEEVYREVYFGLT
jgi:adenylate kinase